jgi:hypothetical protein
MWHAGRMSESSPEDLAVAFRSFARRRREAIGDADPSVVADLGAQFDQNLAGAAAALGVAAAPGAIADELERRRSEDWDDQTLATVRQHATEAGRIVGEMAARVGADGGGNEDDY